MANGRVDSWDEADADTPARVPAPSQPGAPPAAAEEAEPPRLTWRQLLRASPPWIWLISCFSIGSICVMAMIILILIATLR